MSFALTSLLVWILPVRRIAQFDIPYNHAVDNYKTLLQSQNIVIRNSFSHIVVVKKYPYGCVYCFQLHNLPATETTSSTVSPLATFRYSSMKSGIEMETLNLWGYGFSRASFNAFTCAVLCWRYSCRRKNYIYLYIYIYIERLYMTYYLHDS